MRVDAIDHDPDPVSTLVCAVCGRPITQQPRAGDGTIGFSHVSPNAPPGIFAQVRDRALVDAIEAVGKLRRTAA